jgi:hypothetical protein
MFKPTRKSFRTLLVGANKIVTPFLFAALLATGLVNAQSESAKEARIDQAHSNTIQKAAAPSPLFRSLYIKARTGTRLSDRELEKIAFDYCVARGIEYEFAQAILNIEIYTNDESVLAQVSWTRRLEDPMLCVTIDHQGRAVSHSKAVPHDIVVVHPNVYRRSLQDLAEQEAEARHDLDSPDPNIAANAQQRLKVIQELRAIQEQLMQWDKEKLQGHP